MFGLSGLKLLQFARRGESVSRLISSPQSNHLYVYFMSTGRKIADHYLNDCSCLILIWVPLLACKIEGNLESLTNFEQNSCPSSIPRLSLEILTGACDTITLFADTKRNASLTANVSSEKLLLY